MINFDTTNKIKDIMTILNNTRKIAHKSQQCSNFDNELQQDTVQQTTVQTPAQIVQQTTVIPSMSRFSSMFDRTCCVSGCGKPATLWIKGKPYCKEHDPDNRIDTEED